MIRVTVELRAWLQYWHITDVYALFTQKPKTAAYAEA